MTRSPLARESARCSAWPRHTFTLKNEVSPSRHSPSCWIRWVTATRRLVTGVSVLVNRSSGVSTRLPAMVVWLSAAISCAPYSMGCAVGSAFGAEPFRAVPLADRLDAGTVGGVGGPVVLAGQPHDRVGVVLAAGSDGDSGAGGPGRLRGRAGLGGRRGCGC